MFFFLVGTILAGICDGYALAMVKNQDALESTRATVYPAVGVEIIIGMAMWIYVQFHVEFNAIDFIDYGKITTDGLLYMVIQICGAGFVVAGMVTAAAVVATDIRNVHRNTQGNEPTQNYVGHEVNQAYPNSPMPQNSVPTWKKVEQEQQKKF